MQVKDNQNNKEYRTTARATMGDAEYKKKEAEARALRRQKERARKAQLEEAITLPPLKSSVPNELFDLPKLQGRRGLVVKAAGWLSLDRQFEPYPRVNTVAPSWCGLGCRSRTLIIEYISPWFFTAIRC